MKCFRQKLIQQMTIALVVCGLLAVNFSVGKLSELFPNINVNSLLVEEIKENFKDSSESGSADGQTECLVELDWHVSHLFHMKHAMIKSFKALPRTCTLDFANVHLDRFTPPPEA